MAATFSKYEAASTIAKRALIASLLVSLLATGALAETDCEVLIRTIPILAPDDPTETDCCSHSSIVCNEAGRVVEINDNEEILQGTLPGDIDLLTELQRLTMLNSALTGNIPKAVTNLQNLWELAIEFTDLEGSIPETIGNMKNLTEFRIYGNYMESSIPDSVCNLGRLKHLYLGYNSLTGKLPECIGDLADTLEALDVSDNYLVGDIPESFDKLVNLKFLFLNYFWEDYGKCKFTGEIPQSITSFTKLERMWLGVRTLVGPIPDLTKLEFLGECMFLPSGYCREWGLPEDAKCDFTLIPVCVQDCLVVYSMFDEIHAGNCCDHPGIFCDGDNRIIEILTGELNSRISELTLLEKFVVKDNFIEGTLPDELFKMPSLRKIDVSVNLITGPIPAAIGSALSVEEMDFSGNSLSGVFPPDINNLNKLEKLTFAFNKLTGPIPVVSGMEALLSLNATSNMFDSKLPDFSQNLKLQRLDISNNPDLKGEVKVGPALKVVNIHNTFATINNPLGNNLTSGADDGPDTAMIVGIVCFAILAVVAAIGAVSFLFARKNKKKRDAASSYANSNDGSYLASVSSGGKDAGSVMSGASGASGASGVSSIAGAKRVGKWQFIRGKGRKEEGGKKKLTFYMEVDKEACIWSGRYADREVAIKKLKIPDSKLGKLQLAAEAMQLMRHERIVEFIDFEMDFFVMISEMMPLGSLYTRIKNKRINWPDRYQVMLDICEGMAHLHAKKNQDGTSKKEFLHHGLNSKCVRLCVQDGHLRAKVAEFGLDFVQEEGNFLVDREKRFYQAPELYEVAGKKVEFTKKCDMFSAGVVFLELTLLRLPDDLYLEVYPEILKRDLPSSLARVLKGCLDEKPSNRTTFAEIFDILSDNPGEICRLDEGKSEFESFAAESTPQTSRMAEGPSELPETENSAMTVSSAKYRRP